MPRKTCCTVEAITDHGGRVYTLDLAPAGPVPMFRPGQFLHLTVDDYDPSSFWPESRVFSIASSPRDRKRLRVCYSVKGRYTGKMESVLKVGSEVWVKLPYGEFVIDQASDIVLLAGGTGISAFTAFIEALTPASADKVTLAYGARNPSLFLFQEMIQARVSEVPAFRTLWFSEEQADAGGVGTQCFRGRISLDTLWTELADPTKCVFYLSGPPVMLKALGAGLKERGISPEHIRTDAWE